MSKQTYQVVGYYVQSIALQVEANSPDEAEALAYDRIRYEGEGVEIDGAWQDEMEVFEVITNG